MERMYKLGSHMSKLSQVSWSSRGLPCMGALNLLYCVSSFVLPTFCSQNWKEPWMHCMRKYQTCSYNKVCTYPKAHGSTRLAYDKQLPSLLNLWNRRQFLFPSFFLPLSRPDWVFGNQPGSQHTSWVHEPLLHQSWCGFRWGYDTLIQVHTLC